MGKSAILAVKIVSDSKGARADFEKTAGTLDKFQGGLEKATVPAAAAGAAVIAFAKKTGDMAAEAEQNVGAVESVFKQYADKVKEFSSKAATDVGLSSSSYQEMAAVIGSQLKNMGTPMDQVAGATDEMIKKGADMASMFGGTTADAVGALSSLLRGERDPIERYGVSINQAAIDAEKARLGLGKLTGEAEKNANLTATMNLLNKQTTDTMGNFAREADTASGAQQRANAQLADASATIGATFLPAMTWAAAKMSEMAMWASQNKDVVIQVGGAVLALVGTLMVLSGILKAVAIVQGALNLVMAANPVMIVVLAIAALVAGVIIAYNKIGWFRDFVDGVFRNVGTTINGVIGVVSRVANFIGQGFAAAFNLIYNIATGNINGIINAIKGIINWVNSGIEKIKKLFAAGGEVIKFIAGKFGFGGATALTANAYNYAVANPVVSGFAGAIGATAMVGGPVSLATPDIQATRVEQNITIKVEATPGTDRVALGRELADALTTYARATGMKGGVISLG